MAEAFARWVDKSGECWEWTGARDKDGYGAFNYAGKTHRAPTVALEIDGRPVQPGMYACHRCDNPCCVNPAHLYPGTPTQNMEDARARGRTKRGESQHMARLKEADVQHIRSCDDSPRVLAELYGVSRSNITMVRLRRTWRHVP
jgi:hypothetical protein